LESQLTIPTDKYNEWQGGGYAQDVFPDWTDQEREVLISGTCGGCWDALWEDDTEKIGVESDFSYFPEESPW